MRAGALALVAFFACGAIGSCGYHTLTTQDEDVKTAWSQLTGLYQRRSDLIPQLLHAVQAAADPGQQAPIEAAEASARVADSIPLTPELLNDRAAFGRFQAAQRALTGGLEEVIGLAHAHPELEASENYRDLVAQLARTESRIELARQQYIEAVHRYNTTVGHFPTSLTAKLFDFQLQPSFGAAAASTPASTAIERTASQ